MVTAKNEMNTPIRELGLNMKPFIKVLEDCAVMIGITSELKENEKNIIIDFSIRVLGYFTPNDVLNAFTSLSSGDLQIPLKYKNRLTCELLGVTMRHWKNRSGGINAGVKFQQEKELNASQINEKTKQGEEETIRYLSDREKEFIETGNMTIPMFSVNWAYDELKKRGKIKLTTEEESDLKAKASKMAVINNAQPRRNRIKNLKEIQEMMSRNEQRTYKYLCLCAYYEKEFGKKND